MSRSRLVLPALALAALALSGCGMVTGSATAPDTTVVVEEQPTGQPPEPTCAPADVASDTPPEPDLSGSYRDGADYDC